MLCDHCATVLLPEDWVILNLFGRIAFPIFAFQIAEGSVKTKDPKKYALRLTAFCLLSEVPFDLAFYGTPYQPEYQNVFFTLLLGLLAIRCLQKCEGKSAARYFGAFLCVSACACAAQIMCADYGAAGVITILLFYFANQIEKNSKWELYLNRALLVLACIATGLNFDGPGFYNPAQIFALFAYPILVSYNGEKGKPLNKYFFYAFYPAHLIVLGIINFFI